MEREEMKLTVIRVGKGCFARRCGYWQSQSSEWKFGGASGCGGVKAPL